MSINKVILVGNAGKDPEIRHLENGTAVCTLPLATSETYTNKSGEKVTNTEWHNVVLWRSLAEIAEKYVRKGSMLYVEGRIRTRSYDDKDGVKRYTTEIMADTMKMLGRKPEDAVGGQAQPTTETKAAEPADDVYTSAVGEPNDLPF